MSYSISWVTFLALETSKLYQFAPKLWYLFCLPYRTPAEFQLLSSRKPPNSGVTSHSSIALIHPNSLAFVSSFPAYTHYTPPPEIWLKKQTKLAKPLPVKLTRFRHSLCIVNFCDNKKKLFFLPCSLRLQQCDTQTHSQTHIEAIILIVLLSISTFIVPVSEPIYSFELINQ